MILGRLPVALFLLSKVASASSPSIDGLTEFTGQIALNFTREVERKVKVEQDVMEYIERRANEIANNPEFAISEKGVKEFDEELKSLIKGKTWNKKALAEEATAQQASLLLYEIPGDFKDFVSIAEKVHASTVLRLLLWVNAWRDQRNFYRFVVRNYPRLYTKEVWETTDIDWMETLEAICEADNVALAARIRKEIESVAAKKMDATSAKTIGPAKTRKIDLVTLKEFDEKLTLMCFAYDAIGIFELTKLTTACLETRLELLSENSSANLLRLYKESSKKSHLDLGKLSFPKKSPVDAFGLEFLLENGHDQFSMDLHIKNACEGGKLDILKYLHSLDSILVPSYDELRLAAEEGHWNIIDWAYKLNPAKVSLMEYAAMLAINYRFQAFDSLAGANEIIFDQFNIELHVLQPIIKAGNLEALKSVIKRRRLKHIKQNSANFAAKKRQFPIVNWLWEEFKVLPDTISLREAAANVLELVQANNPSLITEELMEYKGLNNPELLQWIYKNRSDFLNEAEVEFLAKEKHSEFVMEWINEYPHDPPSDMTEAYRDDDLTAIIWAKDEWKILPTKENANIAVEHTCDKITEWLYDNYPNLLNMSLLFENTVAKGNLVFAKRLMEEGYTPCKESTFAINWDITCAYRRLEILQWIKEYNLPLNIDAEIQQAAKKGHLKNFEWLVKNYPKKIKDSYAWELAARNGHCEIYKSLLDEYPKGRQRKEMFEDLKKAAGGGHLEVIKLIFEKDFSLVKKSFELEVNSSNYHAYRYVERLQSGE